MGSCILNISQVFSYLTSAATQSTVRAIRTFMVVDVFVSDELMLLLLQHRHYIQVHHIARGTFGDLVTNCNFKQQKQKDASMINVNNTGILNL